MLLIRCPSCDSSHEVPASLLSEIPRKLRCAVCRSVFEAQAADSRPAQPGNAVGRQPGADPFPAEADAGDIGIPDDPSIADTRIADEFTPDASAPMAVDDIDALFDDPLPARPAGLPTPASDEPAAPMMRENPVEPAMATEPDPGKAPAEAADGPAPLPEAASELPVHVRPRPAPSRQKRAKNHRRNTIGLVAATGIGTLAALGIFRHEVVRLEPRLATVFEMFGAEVNGTGLEIRNVRSRILIEDSRETLEVSGDIVNITRGRRSVPILHLSLHAADGHSLYTWTGNPEGKELEPGSKTTFRRRLASPPKDADTVMVRFVAKDDIVSAIR